LWEVPQNFQILQRLKSLECTEDVKATTCCVNDRFFVISQVLQIPKIRRLTFSHNPDCSYPLCMDVVSSVLNELFWKHSSWLKYFHLDGHIDKFQEIVESFQGLKELSALCFRSTNQTLRFHSSISSLLQYIPPSEDLLQLLFSFERDRIDFAKPPLMNLSKLKTTDTTWKDICSSLSACTDFVLSNCQISPLISLHQLLAINFMSEVINLKLEVDYLWCSDTVIHSELTLPSLKSLDIFGLRLSTFQSLFRLHCPLLESVMLSLYFEDNSVEAFQWIDMNSESAPFSIQLKNLHKQCEHAQVDAQENYGS
jgi:hypothetical protein